jgi:type IV pilus assembly protein PilY1
MDTAGTRNAIINGTTVNWPSVDVSPNTASGGNRVNDTFRAAMASRGNFFAATSLPELRSGILSTFAQLAARQGSAGGVALTSPVNSATTLAFFPGYITGTWTGSLRAFAASDLATLAADGTATPVWTAGVPPHDLRRVFTSTAARSPVSFAAGSLSAAQQAQLAGPTWTAAEMVSYLRGDTSLELPAAGTSGTAKFRRRGGSLPDFVNSAPLYVKAPSYGYDAMPTIGSSYAAYVTGRRSSSTGTVYIGGNGGMLHAFAADTGQERFAYVPRGVYPDLPRLGDAGYVHRYFVDGQITAGDYHDGTSWRSVIVGTTGAGGASVFAIDQTQVGSPTAGQVLWDYTKAESADIGHIMGRGLIGRIRSGSGPNDFRWVYINGNGYESTNNRAALLVIGLTDGIVTTIPVGPSWSAVDGPAARNGMGPPTVRYDVNRNIVGVYAGDKQGNLWRFDFSSGMPSTASGFGTSTTPLFTATDSSGVRQPITTAPRLVPHPSGGLYVVFGTGKLIDLDDPTSTAPQALYGIWDKSGLTGTIAKTSLETLTVTTAGDGSRGFSVAGISPLTRLGWTISLTGGERVIGDPSLELGQLTLATFRPNSIEDPCSGGGASNVFRIDLATGRGDVVSTPGMVGLLTPALTMSSPQRTLSGADLGGSLRSDGRVTPPQPGTPLQTPSQCTHYGTAIQGRPSVIARTCPVFAPLRVWRQPLR